MTSLSSTAGAKTDRPGLIEALSYVRDGDVLVVWKFDRARPLAAASHRDRHRFERAPHWSAFAYGKYRYDDARRTTDLSCLRRSRCFRTRSRQRANNGG